MLAVALIWEPEWTFCPEIVISDAEKPIDMKSNIRFENRSHAHGRTSAKAMVGSGGGLFLVSERDGVSTTET